MCCVDCCLAESSLGDVPDVALAVFGLLGLSLGIPGYRWQRGHLHGLRFPYMVCASNCLCSRVHLRHTSKYLLFLLRGQPGMGLARQLHASKGHRAFGTGSQVQRGVEESDPILTALEKRQYRHPHRNTVNHSERAVSRGTSVFRRRSNSPRTRAAATFQHPSLQTPHI